MTQAQPYIRRVGTVRPSHLMFTAGVGGLVDLPNFTVLIRGIDDWSYDQVPQPVIAEDRLLAAVRASLRAPGVRELRQPPWLPGADDDPRGPATRVGAPVTPFPQWFRCTRCNTLAGLDSRTFGFDNSAARRPDRAHFFHPDCGRRRRLAVPARFLLACVNGHLDDFPYSHFVHKGVPCPSGVSHPTLRMIDHGGNLGANVTIECTNCADKRNIRDAMGIRGLQNLPACRGRHPHLGRFERCAEVPRLLVLGASNQWFAEALSVLSVPPTGASALEAVIASMWSQLQTITSRDILGFALTQPTYRALAGWPADAVWEAIETRRALTAGEASPFGRRRPDVLTPEWEAFTTKPFREPTPDFTVREGDIPDGLQGLFSDVILAERLREVRALVGFTRLDAPDPEDPDVVLRAPIGRAAAPSWVPASEVRGEGLFLRVHEDLLAEWESRVAGSRQMEEHRLAYGRFRRNRYSDRINGPFDEFRNWPGPRYIALHTLSHLLIRAISLECGYGSASLSERIYAGTDDEPRSGILIYTAVPDAEGTLGGVVALGEPDSLNRLVGRALDDAMHCSSDPLCAERLPAPPADFLHGAACHVCLFVSETTCERGNRFLDRRFIVPVADEHLALLHKSDLLA
jgi:hypothetical protein